MQAGADETHTHSAPFTTQVWEGEGGAKRGAQAALPGVPFPMSAGLPPEKPSPYDGHFLTI